jgi:hypothetical protein
MFEDTGARVHVQPSNVPVAHDPQAKHVHLVNYKNLEAASSFFRDAAAIEGYAQQCVVLVSPTEHPTALKLAGAAGFHPHFLGKPAGKREMLMTVQNMVRAAAGGDKGHTPAMPTMPNTPPRTLSQLSSSSDCGPPSPNSKLKPRVLFVDDNLVNRKVGKALLERLDVPCELAESGMQAVKAQKDHAVDLIFMDRYLVAHHHLSKIIARNCFCLPGAGAVAAGFASQDAIISCTCI